MAHRSQSVASALNRLTEKPFTAALSQRDRHNLSDFIADFFCTSAETDAEGSEEEEEPGKCLRAALTQTNCSSIIIIIIT